MRKKNLIQVQRMADVSDPAGRPFYIRPSAVQSVNPFGRYCEVVTGKGTFLVAESADSLVRRINGGAS